MVGEVNEILFIKHLSQCLVHSKYSVNYSIDDADNGGGDDLAECFGSL